MCRLSQKDFVYVGSRLLLVPFPFPFSLSVWGFRVDDNSAPFFILHDLIHMITPRWSFGRTCIVLVTSAVRSLVRVTILVATNVRSDLVVRALVHVTILVARNGGLNLVSPEQFCDVDRRNFIIYFYSIVLRGLCVWAKTVITYGIIRSCRGFMIFCFVQTNFGILAV